MRVTVDMARCQDHGQCAIAAPAVFLINDEGNLEYDGNPADSERDYVLDAADVCPAQAISIEED
jgi:ferredoxin